MGKWTGSDAEEVQKGGNMLYGVFTFFFCFFEDSCGYFWGVWDIEYGYGLCS